MIAGIYTPKYHLDTRFYQIFANHYRDFCVCYDERFHRTYGNFRFVVDKVIDKFLRCGKPKDGFAYVECEDCGHRYLVPFSCKTKMCPSCGQKRLLEWSEWLFEEVLLNVEHRHWVFTIPACLRWCFRFHRKLLGDLAGCAARTLTYYIQEMDRPQTGESLSFGYMRLIR
jgi:ribosomal protein S27E